MVSEIIDDCESASGRSTGAAGTVTLNTFRFTEASSGLNMIKNGTSFGDFWFSRNVDSYVFRNKTFLIDIYISQNVFDSNYFGGGDATFIIRISSTQPGSLATSNYYDFYLSRADLSVGWKTYRWSFTEAETMMHSYTNSRNPVKVGTPDVDDMRNVSVFFGTASSSVTISAGNIVIDNIRLNTPNLSDITLLEDFEDLASIFDSLSGVTYTANTARYTQGIQSVNMVKTTTLHNDYWLANTFTAFDFTAKRILVDVFVRDQTALDKLEATGNCMFLILGNTDLNIGPGVYSTTNSYQFNIGKSDLSIGWNTFEWTQVQAEAGTDNYPNSDDPTKTGTPDVTSISGFIFRVMTTGNSIGISAGEIAIDNLRFHTSMSVVPTRTLTDPNLVYLASENHNFKEYLYDREFVESDTNIQTLLSDPADNFTTQRRLVTKAIAKGEPYTSIKVTIREGLSYTIEFSQDKTTWTTLTNDTIYNYTFDRTLGIFLRFTSINVNPLNLYDVLSTSELTLEQVTEKVKELYFLESTLLVNGEYDKPAFDVQFGGESFNSNGLTQDGKNLYIKRTNTPDSELSTDENTAIGYIRYGSTVEESLTQTDIDPDNLEICYRKDFDSPSTDTDFSNVELLNNDTVKVVTDISQFDDITYTTSEIMTVLIKNRIL